VSRAMTIQLSVWTLAQDRRREAGVMNGITHASGSHFLATTRSPFFAPLVATRSRQGAGRTV
jgi:hypothetical protein